MRKTNQHLTFRFLDRKVVAAIKSMAKHERRSRNDLLRDMVKAYQREQDRNEEQEILRLFDEVQREESAHPTTVEDLRRENDRLMAYGAQQARKLGIKPRDTNRLIREHRATRL